MRARLCTGVRRPIAMCASQRNFLGRPLTLSLDPLALTLPFFVPLAPACTTMLLSPRRPVLFFANTISRPLCYDFVLCMFGAVTVPARPFAWSYLVIHIVSTHTDNTKAN